MIVDRMIVGQSGPVIYPNTTHAQAERRLGFGCAMLMSRMDRTTSLRLLSRAFEMGVTHFDTARLYGYGEAEGVLGDFLKPHRAKVTITTKVGILPPKKTALLTIAKAAARNLVKLNPGLRRKFRAKAESMTSRGHFDIPTVTRSFETSLRELKTDYVDYLLLHECTADDLSSTELLDFLQTTQRQGKVRRFGLATSISATEEALARHKAYTGVLQFPSSAKDKNIRKVFGADHRIFTHSALGECLNQAHAMLQTNSEIAHQYSERLGIDVSRKSNLAELLMRYAVAENPGGIALFSSTSEQNIEANCRAAVRGPLAAQDISVVESLCGMGARDD